MNDDILPDPDNSNSLGTFKISYEEDDTLEPGEWKVVSRPLISSVPNLSGLGLSGAYEDDMEGQDMFFSIFRTMLEQSYLLGRITKTELIEGIRKLYNEEGLDISEAIEEIEQRKDKFYQEITEHVRQQLKGDVER